MKVLQVGPNAYWDDLCHGDGSQIWAFKREDGESKYLWSAKAEATHFSLWRLDSSNSICKGRYRDGEMSLSICLLANGEFPEAEIRHVLTEFKPKKIHLWHNLRSVKHFERLKEFVKSLAVRSCEQLSFDFLDVA